MPVIVDHVFICTAASAPAAGRLRVFGLTEGTPNQHPGQGTACRRFFFRNAMLELIWVDDTAAAQSEQTRRTNLWDRWSTASRGASPFGIILRSGSSPAEACPFPSWEYRPKTMPDLSLQIASAAGLDEPMWCYMPTGRAPSEAPPERRQPLVHPAGFREITGVHLVCPPPPSESVTRDMADRKAITLEIGAEHLLDLRFDGGHKGSQADFRPDLPLVFRW
jgi:Glyoxalase-like domain